MKVTHINLLPWREQSREERKQEFLVSLAVTAILTIVLILFIHMLIAGWINNREERNKILKDQISSFDREIKEITALKEEKTKLIARMHVIQALQADRAQVVHIFGDLVRMMPEGVYLTSIKRVGPNFTVTGRAESNTRISALMRNIDASPSLAKPLLTEIKTDQSQGSYGSDFILQFQQRVSASAESLTPGHPSKESKKGSAREH